MDQWSEKRESFRLNRRESKVRGNYSASEDGGLRRESNSKVGLRRRGRSERHIKISRRKR